MKFLLQLDDLFAAERDPRPLQIRVRHQGSLPMAFGPEVLLFVQLPVRFPGTGDGVRRVVGAGLGAGGSVRGLDLTVDLHPGKHAAVHVGHAGVGSLGVVAGPIFIAP